MPASFLEIEPYVFSVIISFNPTEAEHLARDLEELGVIDLPRWQLRNLVNGKMIAANPLPEFFREMTAAGGEKAYVKARIARAIGWREVVISQVRRSCRNWLRSSRTTGRRNVTTCSPEEVSVFRGLSWKHTSGELPGIRCARPELWCWKLARAGAAQWICQD